MNANVAYIRWVAILVWVALASILLSRQDALAQRPPSKMSSDELLTFTLNDLREQMQKVIENNRQISEKNEAFRKRIFYIKQQLRELENRKITLLEESLQITDGVKLNTKEQTIVQNKVNDLKEEQKFWQEEKLKIQGSMTASPENRDIITQKISEMEESVRELKEKLKNLNASDVKQKYSKEKGTLLRLISDLKNEIKRDEKIVMGLEGRNQKPQASKSELFSTKAGLENDLLDHKGVLRALEGRHKEFLNTAENYKQKRDNAIEAYKRETNQVFGYQMGLADAIDNALKTHDELTAQFRVDQKDIGEMLKMLGEESLWLQRKTEVVQRSLALAQESKKRASQKEGSLGSNKDMNSELEVIQKEEDQIVAEIQEQKEILRTYIEEEKSLKNEIEGIKRDVVRLKAEAQGTAKNSLASQKNKLSDSINERIKHQRGLQRNIDVLSKDINSLQRSIEDARKEQESLNKQMTGAKYELEEQQNLGALATGKSDSLEGAESSAIEKAKKEVQALTLRAEMLKSSLMVVEAEYNAEDLASEGFTREQQELKEYLALLVQENGNLQQKVLALSIAMDKLLADKRRLEKSR